MSEPTDAIDLRGWLCIGIGWQADETKSDTEHARGQTPPPSAGRSRRIADPNQDRDDLGDAHVTLVECPFHPVGAAASE